jgi:hypothetical protein
MPASIRFFLDGDQPFEGSLGDITGPLDADGPFPGDSQKITLKNTGDTALKALTLGVEGEGATRVQLAAQENMWAEPGQPIVLDPVLEPGESTVFWARGIFSIGDAEAELVFNFVTRGVSVFR